MLTALVLQARPLREACCCPVLLIGIAGPYIAVSGAVFIEKLVVQNLTDYISLVPRPSLSDRSPFDDAILRAARLLTAIKKCIDALDTYYLAMKETIPPVVPRTAVGPASKEFRVKPSNVQRNVWPSFTEYSFNGREYTLTYKEPLDRVHLWEAVYRAEAVDSSGVSTQVVVKFAHKYCEAAHRLLAEAGYAPPLLYCEKVPSSGMTVVVMDYVDGEAVEGTLTGDATLQLRTAMQTLHQGGYVWGNLREPNVLVVKGDDSDRVKLIDFDWCGKELEARYPTDVNQNSAMWHHEVKPGGLIRKAHDEHHFNKMTGEELYAKS